MGKTVDEEQSDGSKSVGIWIGVSTEDQARGESPEHHEKRARIYAEIKGWARLKRTSPDSLHLLPIFASLLDDQAITSLTALIGDDPIVRAVLGALWRDIPIFVEAIRNFCDAIRYKTQPPTRPAAGDGSGGVSLQCALSPR
jgi:hypothetical protein